MQPLKAALVPCPPGCHPVRNSEHIRCRRNLRRIGNLFYSLCKFFKSCLVIQLCGQLSNLIGIRRFRLFQLCDLCFDFTIEARFSVRNCSVFSVTTPAYSLQNFRSKYPHCCKFEYMFLPNQPIGKATEILQASPFAKSKSDSKCTKIFDGHETEYAVYVGRKNCDIANSRRV